MSEKYLNGTQILNLEISGTMWLWDSFLPAKGLAGLTGASDCGKSTLLRQLAIAVASRKRDFLGSPLNPRTGKVLFISTEDDEIGTKLGLTKQAAGLGIANLDNLLFLFEIEDLHNSVKKILRNNSVDLIIIDAWSDTFTGNPNSFADVRGNIKKLKALANEYDCCIIMLHHNTKNSENFAPDKNRVNGSQGIEASVRSLFELRTGMQDDQRLLTIVKGNYITPERKRISSILQLDGDNMLFRHTGSYFSFSTQGPKREYYDKSVWLRRMREKRDSGLPYESAIVELSKEYENEDIPSKTWFITNMKDMHNGQSNNMLSQ